MKFNHLTSVFALALFSITAASCGSTPEESTTETPEVATAENSENKSAQPAAIDTTIVYNANLVTQDELSTIGVSAEMIEQIIAARPFSTMNELDELLGEDLDKQDIYQRMFVPFNLNTTPEADFKMIPGVGDKMAHEFEEYRPYKSIKQFRKEIGKYVDEAEVARYENYVFVPIELNSATEEDIKALPGVGDKMAHEFEEYRPYKNMKQFQKEIGKYVDDKELKRLERFVYLEEK